MEAKTMISELDASEETADKLQNAVSVWSDGRLNVHSERRAGIRKTANLEARFFYGNRVYTGTVTNISDRGMFINTAILFPKDSKVEIMLCLNNKVLKVPVTVRRNVRSDYQCFGTCDNGIGVELLSIPPGYREYVGR